MTPSCKSFHHVFLFQFYEAFEIHTATSTLHLTMTGQGVSPIIDLSIEAGVLECGTVLNGEYREEIFKVSMSVNL